MLCCQMKNKGSYVAMRVTLMVTESSLGAGPRLPASRALLCVILTTSMQGFIDEKKTEVHGDEVTRMKPRSHTVGTYCDSNPVNNCQG